MESIGFKYLRAGNLLCLDGKLPLDNTLILWYTGKCR